MLRVRSELVRRGVVHLAATGEGFDMVAMLELLCRSRKRKMTLLVDQFEGVWIVSDVSQGRETHQHNQVMVLSSVSSGAKKYRFGGSQRFVCWMETNLSVFGVRLGKD